jgi:hypothetical protein
LHVDTVMGALITAALSITNLIIKTNKVNWDLVLACKVLLCSSEESLSSAWGGK